MLSKHRRVCIEVSVSFKDADAVLDLLNELGVKAEIRFPNKKRRGRGTYRRLTKTDVHTILGMKDKTNGQIAAKVGCSKTTVRQVLMGKHKLC